MQDSGFLLQSLVAQMTFHVGRAERHRDRPRVGENGEGGGWGGGVLITRGVLSALRGVRALIFFSIVRGSYSPETQYSHGLKGFTTCVVSSDRPAQHYTIVSAMLNIGPESRAF